jgi:uncharacterized protein (UPF0332 family)
VIAQDDLFLEKARESLAGADSELAQGRYNNCANRCYYACFQAAIWALDRAGIYPQGASGEWSHAFVPAQFDGQLIGRRKVYSPELARNYALRERADYAAGPVSQTETSRALRRARSFVQAIASTAEGMR